VIITSLLNEISIAHDHFILVLDDYHVINSEPVNEALAFMLEYIPMQMHLAIITREDPKLPLARLRAGNQLTELKSADLRFTRAEATAFLNQVMELNLAEDDISMLETRTEGWVAGLQLAGLSMQVQKDATGFIKSFTGWQHFILEYLFEEVLRHQPAEIREFLLSTSILDSMCGSLCDAVVGSHDSSRQETLEKLVHTNLFIIPLDDERRWYRYHQLFADLLHQQLYLQDKQVKEACVPSTAELHARASLWYEENGFEIEAFKHAINANDIDRVVRLLQGHGVPLYYRGAMTLVLHWLESLSTETLNCYPILWVTYANVLILSGQIEGVEQKLKAAEETMPSM
jgi:LuxR family maltose regulon positive regulatory protein